MNLKNVKLKSDLDKELAKVKALYESKKADTRRDEMQKIKGEFRNSSLKKVILLSKMNLEG